MKHDDLLDNPKSGVKPDGSSLWAEDFLKDHQAATVNVAAKSD